MGARGVTDKRVVIFLDPRASKADRTGFCSCNQHAAISLRDRLEQKLGIWCPDLTPRFQIGNMNALMLLYRLDESDDSGEIGWPK